MTRKVTRLLRKLLALIIGLPIIIVGIILIPLPGPGILITFLGLFVLSYEFEWARKYFETFKDKILKIWRDAQAKADAVGKPKDVDPGDKR